MLYTNYKQIAEITLNSQNAESVETTAYTLNMGISAQPRLDANGDPEVANDGSVILVPTTTTASVSFNSKYHFKINLLNPMSPNVRVAVKSFINHNAIQSGVSAGTWDEVEKPVGNIYIDNLYDKNSYNSDPVIQNKFHLLSYPLCYKKIEEYYNNDILNTSKSIQNGAFMNNYFDIVVDAKIKNSVGTEITGLPTSSKWSMTLIVYDIEKEENPKAFSDGLLPMMPPRY